MATLSITGGKPLYGSVQTAGNKNAVLPMIAAALLTDEPLILENVPDIGDLRSMLTIAENLGVEVNFRPKEYHLEIHAKEIDEASLNRELSSRIRASILFAAPLVYRTGKAVMPPPGGDVIGRRRLDTHFVGLRKLGFNIEIQNDIEFTVNGQLTGEQIFLPEASVTATEQMLLAAVTANGKTTIMNAACEPHVQDLAILLQAMGAKIYGIGTNVLTINGGKKLYGARHKVVPDHTEAGSFLALAAATGGEITVENVVPAHFRMTDHVFRRLGIALEYGENSITIPAQQSREIIPDPRGGIPVIDDGLWPQFPSDLMSVTIVMATQLHGTVLLFEKLFESRMYFVDRLIAMGANAVICDPHRVVVHGPAQLQGIELSSPDIRAGIALLSAALCARGNSIIRNVKMIDRGYENIDRKLRNLGAEVQRIDE